jgi:prophage tail gpP-like protein
MSEVRTPTRPSSRGASQQSREAREAPFTLLVSGEHYAGWQALRVTRGLERATADFDLTVSERWSLEEDIWQITPGEPCEIQLDGETVLTGYVDKYGPSYDAGSHSISLSGRSKTCDLVDCSVTVDGGQFKGMTVGQIARILAQPFGVEVVVSTQTPPEPEVQVQQGETCFALIERLSRVHELLVTDDALGRLVLTRAGSGRATTDLIHGKNILTASAELDHSQRFSDYIVKAQRPGNRTKDGGPIDQDWGGGGDGGWQPSLVERVRQLRGIPNISARYRERMRIQAEAAAAKSPGKTAPKTLTQIVGRARDAGVTRYRPHVIVAEKQADDAAAAQRADWEMRRRVGQSLKATITVNGWRQEDGKLWATNDLVWVEAPWLALSHELIIGEVTHSFDDGGEITELSLTLPDAFLPDPSKRKGKQDPAKGKGGKAGKKAGGKKKGGTGDPWAGWQPTGGAT